MRSTAFPQRFVVFGVALIVDTSGLSLRLTNHQIKDQQHTTQTLRCIKASLEPSKPPSKATKTFLDHQKAQGVPDHLRHCKFYTIYFTNATQNCWRGRP
ncbi:hypothetical protein BKA80DRAFT_274415 [Phyllosticta citrichinensis]